MIIELMMNVSIVSKSLRLKERVCTMNNEYLKQVAELRRTFTRYGKADRDISKRVNAGTSNNGGRDAFGTH